MVVCQGLCKRKYTVFNYRKKTPSKDTPSCVICEIIYDKNPGKMCPCCKHMMRWSRRNRRNVNKKRIE